MPEVSTQAWCGVIGDPIAHSLSPVIHQAAYDRLGLDLEYRRIQTRPEQLGELIRPGTGCRGLSVTMPLKEDIAAHLDRVDGLARVTGAVNTAVPAGALWAGFNTDVYGIVAACREYGVDAIGSALVLGAGATAASALAALVQLGARDITVSARKPRQIMARAHAMGITVRYLPLHLIGSQEWNVDLVISTIPAGGSAELDLRLGEGTAVLDVAYDPWPSPLVARVGARRIAIPGLAMLVHQAVQQVSLFTSHTPDPQWMYTALAEHGVSVPRPH